MVGHLKHVGTPGQKSATRSLMKFCRDHGHAASYIETLEKFEAALDSRDLPTLKRLAKILRHAGMGSFVDWFPTPSLPNESQEYVETVWNALYGHWLQQVRAIEEAKDA